MSDLAGAPVVVGVDGSDSALDAVRTAAREALVRNRPLRIVHAFTWPLLNVPLGPSPVGPPTGGLRHQAERTLDEAVKAATTTAPEVTVTGEVIDGESVPVLLRAARGAALVVLGHRGLGGFAELLLGSTTQQVAEYATCPVLVVRGESDPRGPVLVGVDGSELSIPAVDFAGEEAALRGTGLLAVHTWRHPVSTGPGDMLPLVYDPNALREEEERLLAESVAGHLERHPETPFEQRLVQGGAAHVLVDESTKAQLVVVGARGRGGLTGLLLGSVSQALLRHAHCPVAVVPHPHTRSH